MLISKFIGAAVVGGASIGAAVMLAGCSTLPSMPEIPASFISTGSIAKPAAPEAKRGKPVRADKATRMYVWAGFKEKDCSPVPAKMAVAKAPGKGTVSFKANESITVQHSASGKCIGQRMAGTGIYYQPTKGQDGDDHFTVTASTESGQVITRSFHVTIRE